MNGEATQPRPPPELANENASMLQKSFDKDCSTTRFDTGRGSCRVLSLQARPVLRRGAVEGFAEAETRKIVVATVEACLSSMPGSDKLW
jgi:hypothetical protein